MTTLRQELLALANPAIAAHSARFFKTGPGEYGEGDRFLGIRVPALRKLARSHRELSRAKTLALLRSPWHEVRLTALLILVEQFQRGDTDERRAIYNTYLDNVRWINSWDLIDTTAPHIVGGWLVDRSRREQRVLRRLARSQDLWERRIAMLATFTFIRQDDYQPTLDIAEILLHDEHDLIHKAVGWLLREVGKRDRAVLEDYLGPRYQTIPRTMLRYAIERLPKVRRRAYITGKVQAVNDQGDI